ncbi:hypothetical protein TNCV_5111761 [Trichonephila clavipes]|nr:hypothetical protein TNCV_5111761 [Trichonephila clavipes]
MSQQEKKRQHINSLQSLNDVIHWSPSTIGGGQVADACSSFQDFGDNFKLQEQLSGGSVVVVHEEPHPQMTGTLSYRPEETGGTQREKIAKTRHRRRDTGNWTTDIAFYRGQKTARWWSVCTTPCTVCTFNACPSEKAFSVVPGTPELRETMNGDEYSLQMIADSV